MKTEIKHLFPDFDPINGEPIEYETKRSLTNRELEIVIDKLIDIVDKMAYTGMPEISYKFIHERLDELKKDLQE